MGVPSLFLLHEIGNVLRLDNLPGSERAAGTSTHASNELPQLLGNELIANDLVANAILCQVVFIEEMAERTVSYVVQESTEP